MKKQTKGNIIEITARYGEVRKLDKISRGTIKTWEKYLKREYNGIKFPICCETCKFVGNAFWHCHNPESFKQHINVMPNDVCSKWVPNEGLLIWLWIRKDILTKI